MVGQVRIPLHQLSAPHQQPADVLFRGYAGGMGAPPRVWYSHDTVPGTPAEHQQWTAASRWYQATVCAAEAELTRVTAGWSRHLPGSRDRVARARQRHRELTDAATAAYRPVHEAIAHRLAAVEAEELRRQEDLRHEQVWRLRQEQRRQRELRDRYQAVAAKPVWGWCLSEYPDTTHVWVFRHDVPPADRSPSQVTRHSRERLIASGLEDMLLFLRRNMRVASLSWDAAARLRVVEETTTDHLHGSFNEWWSTSTREHWSTPTTFPPPPTPCPTAITNPSGTSHHSSHGAGFGSF